MRKLLAIACLLLAAGTANAATAMPALTDADGRTVALAVPATRVVTVAPSLTELVYAAGAGGRLVGVSAYSDFPQAAQALPAVADAAGISLEALLALRPDLVLTWKSGTRESDVQKIRAARIPVFAIEVVQLDDVPKALRAIGQLTGGETAAEAAAAGFQKHIGALRAANTGKPVVRTFVEISALPLMTVSNKHFISEAIRACGGVNVFGEVQQLVFQPSRESLLARKADLVLFARGNAKERHDEAMYQGLAAARDGLVLPLTADYIFRPGPRLQYAVDEVCTAMDAARHKLNK